jgi:hypothetical protein
MRQIARNGALTGRVYCHRAGREHHIGRPLLDATNRYIFWAKPLGYTSQSDFPFLFKVLNWIRRRHWATLLGYSRAPEIVQSIVFQRFSGKWCAYVMRSGRTLGQPKAPEFLAFRALPFEELVPAPCTLCK